MANLYSTETAGVDTRPAVKPSAGAYGARYRRYRASITLAAQATTDNILLAVIPSGSIFAGGVLTASVSLGTAVIAIGTSQTHASNGQLRAAGTFTAVDTPTNFGNTAVMAQAALASDTRIYLTIATAALPASGTLVVDLYYSNA
jgi:hypothetical protein